MLEMQEAGIAADTLCPLHMAGMKVKRLQSHALISEQMYRGHVCELGPVHARQGRRVQVLRAEVFLEYATNCVRGQSHTITRSKQPLIIHCCQAGRRSIQHMLQHLPHRD